ncbi:hypothetical protein SESBI_13420 [Sesbania bispinosa]|nr:hypothetical protein SESBI_13420 [Sesbania bispinosa]
MKYRRKTVRRAEKHEQRKHMNIVQKKRKEENKLEWMLVATTPSAASIAVTASTTTHLSLAIHSSPPWKFRLKKWKEEVRESMKKMREKGEGEMREKRG